MVEESVKGRQCLKGRRSAIPGLIVSEVKLNEKATRIVRHEAITVCVCLHSITSSMAHHVATYYSVYNNFPYGHVMISLVTACHVYFCA